MKLRCTFAPSTVLNVAIQKTLVLFRSFLLLSVVCLPFPIPRRSPRQLRLPSRNEQRSRSFQLRGNNKRETRKRMRGPFSFRYSGGTEEREGRESVVVNFLSPLSVNNVYFLPVVSFFFLRRAEASLFRKFNYAPHRCARACGGCFSARPSSFQ